MAGYDGRGGIVWRQEPKVVYLQHRDDAQRAEVLKRIYGENVQALRAFLRVRLSSADEVEDLVQDTWMRLARMDDLQEKISGAHGDARSYILSIAGNLIVDRARRNAVREIYARERRWDTRSEIAVETPESTLATAQELERAKEVILALSPKCRRAFILSRVRQMSYRQIAEEMGVSVKRVEKYISRALAAICEAVPPP